MQKHHNITALLLALLLCGCTEGGQSGRGGSGAASAPSQPERTTLTGVVGICTTSTDMEVIVEDSSSVFVETINRRIFGSSEPGDSVHVTCFNVDDHLISTTVVNIRQMAGQWTESIGSQALPLTLHLQADNHVRTFRGGQETHDYMQWNLFDGLLILTTPPDSAQSATMDTLRIVALTSDSLVVSDGSLETTYLRTPAPHPEPPDPSEISE